LAAESATKLTVFQAEEEPMDTQHEEVAEPVVRETSGPANSGDVSEIVKKWSNKK